MVKKKRTKTTRKRTSTPKITKDVEKLNTILIENFVKLQKAMTNITVKFDNLADQISKLLQLFEISAKSFAEKLETGVPDIEKDKEFLGKLNKLLDQNKVIAKGLTLMEDKLKERVYGSSAHRQLVRRPQPPFKQQQPFPSQQNQAGYLPSSVGKTRRTREIE